MPRGTKAKEKEDNVSSKKPQPKSTTTTTATKSQSQGKKELTREQQKDRVRKRLSDPAYLGRSVSQEKLGRRLQKLYNYLCDRKQKDDEDEDDEPSLDIIAAQLIQNHIIEHSEKSITILAACCLYDVFRVYAPDAPYASEQLESLFRLFIDQLAGLEKGPTGSAFFNRRLYLLNGLAAVKAFTVLPPGEELAVHMFRTCFDIIYGLREHPLPVVTTQLTDILGLYFEDSPVFPQLLDEIFDTLSNKGKESGNVHLFISNIIKNSADRLQEPITKYLNDLLEQQSDADARERCHQIVFEVNKISPDLLLEYIYVMPQLEAQLTVENDEVRTDLVRLLSRMFGHKDSALHTTYRKLFEAFLKRFTDKNEHIRETMLDFLAHYLQYHNDHAAEFSNLLAQRLRDPAENVRQRAVATACEIAEVRPQILTEVALDELFLRMRDRKPSIRKDLTIKLGMLYRDMLVKHKDTKMSLALRAKYMVIPSKIMQNYSVPGEDLRVDHVMDECLLSLPKQSVESKTKMLVEFVQNLLQDGTKDESLSFTAFTRLMRDKKAFQTEFNKYLTLRTTEDLDDDDDDAPISRQLRVLAQLLPFSPTPDKSYEHFQKLNKMEKKVFNLLSTVADVQGTFAQQTTAKNELLQKIGKKSAQYDHISAITQKLRHTACSSETIPFMLDLLKEELELDTTSALPVMRLVELMSSLYPEFFHEHFQDLSELLGEKDVLDRVLAIIGNVGAQFQIGASAGKTVTKKLTALLSEGTPYQARHAVRALHSLFPTTNVFGSILKELIELMDSNTSLESVLPALGQIAKMQPAEFKKHAAHVLDYVVDKVLTGKVTKPSPKKSKKKGHSPLANKTRPASGDLKGYGAQLLAKHLEGRHNLEKPESDTVASKYIGLIVGILEDGNEVQEDEDDELRRVDGVVAACAALVRIAAYEHVFTPQQFETFAWVARDRNSLVRRGFAAKLFNGLKDVKLHVKYLSIPSLFVMDKDFSAAAKNALGVGIKARRSFIKTNTDFMEKNQSSRTEITPEYALLHLIHLIAHCPDFEGDAPNYLHTSRYLSFFASEIMHELDHYIFLKMLLENLKFTKDAVATQSSKFLVVDEIALLILQEKSENRNWRIPKKKYPADFLYPSTIFIAPKANTEPAAPQRHLSPGWKLPDQSKKLLLGGGGGQQETMAQQAHDNKEKHEKPEKQKPAAKPTPKRRLTYDKEETPKKKKKKKGTSNASTSTPEKSSVALRPRRTIQSYFEKERSDDEDAGSGSASEEEEEEEEEEYVKPSQHRKSTSPSPNNKKRTAEAAKREEKRKEESKEEEEEEKEEEKRKEEEEKRREESGEEAEASEREEEVKPKKQPTKKGKGKAKDKEEEEAEEEKDEAEEQEEEKEEEKEQEKAPKKGKKQNGTKAEVDSETDGKKSKKKGKPATTNHKTKQSPPTRKKRKGGESEEEGEEEEKPAVASKKKPRKAK